MATFRKVTMQWKELSEVLSKADILMADEDIEQLTLVKPQQLLLHTVRLEKKSKPKEE